MRREGSIAPVGAAVTGFLKPKVSAGGGLRGEYNGRRMKEEEE